jgi:tetratricopeptide (TPR) repeat protein
MFVGRDREMREIESLLAGRDDVQLRATLDGLPGIGKTELARQLVARLSRGNRFPGGIFWFAAENTDLRMQWARIAEDLGAPETGSFGERASWVVRKLEQLAQRGEAVLIVLDNVETWAPPPGPLPESSAVRLLVTTRTRWLHNSFRPYEVRPLAFAHAKQLLDSIVGRNVHDADDLLDVLGGHVLSVELAATYLREYGTSPRDYLEQLLAGKAPAASVVDQTSYRATAESAFRLLWRRLSSALKDAWLRAAHLAPTWFSTELADAIGLDAEHRRGLVRLHILERDGQGLHQMHRLLREFALVEVPDASSMQAAVIAGAVAVLDAGDPQLRFRRYRRDAASFEHLLGTVGAASCLPLKTACALALHQLGDLQRAGKLFEEVLARNLVLNCAAHPSVAASRVNLAALLRQVGDLSRASSLLEQALESHIATHGDDHPIVTTTRAMLAGLLRQHGELHRARVLYEHVLAVDTKTYGRDHPEVATTRANLAGVLRMLGVDHAPYALYDQALSSLLKSYGDDHPAVIAIRSQMAWLLVELRSYPAARELLEQSLAAGQRTYGDDHPMVAISRANLAVLLTELGDWKTARTLLEQALATNSRTYGAEHPEVAATRANLARVLEKLGDIRMACRLRAESLASDVKTYGAGHPIVKRRRLCVARLLVELGHSRNRVFKSVLQDPDEGTIYGGILEPVVADAATLIRMARAAIPGSDELPVSWHEHKPH